MEKFEHLLISYHNAIKREERCLRAFPTGRKERIINSLFGIHNVFALHAIFILCDPIKARTHFYIMAKLGLYSHEKFSTEIELFFRFFYAILSDDDPLIHYYMKLKLSGDGEENGGLFITSHIYRAIRAALQNNQQMLRQSVARIKETAEYNDFSPFLPFPLYFPVLLIKIYRK